MRKVVGGQWSVVGWQDAMMSDDPKESPDEEQTTPDHPPGGDGQTQASITDLFGKIDWDPRYDYKEQRRRR